MSVSDAYRAFLEAKSQRGADAGFEPVWLPGFLFDFQAALTAWAIRKGRPATFADCGLGKTPMQLVWAENVVRHTNGRVLILTPLAVAAQTVREGGKFGVDVRRARTARAGITVTNYEQLHHVDPADFVGVVCDESSILKAFDGGATRGDYRLHAPAALPAAVHGHGRAERLHRTWHQQRGAGPPRPRGHAQPLLQE